MVRYPYSFTWSAEIEQFFVDRKVYLGHHIRIAGVFKEGETVTLPCRVVAEENATMPNRGFNSAGAFTYSIANLGSDTEIGRYCSISWGVRALGINHPVDRVSTHLFTFRPHWTNAIKREYGKAPTPARFDGAEYGPIKLGHDVWIGQDVAIRRGVRIGTGAVVASGAHVTKDVPAYAIVGGVPAKIIRYRFDTQMIERMLMSRWWDYHAADFAGMDVVDPIAFLDELDRRVEAGEITPYRAPKFDIGAEIAALIGAGGGDA